MQIHWGKGQFAEPGGDIAVHVNVPASFTGTHGDAEHTVFTQSHRSR